MWRSREYSMCCGRTWLWSISSATARRSMSKVFNVEQKPLQDCKTIFFRVLLVWSVWIDPIESHQNHFVHYTNFDPKVFKQIQIEACDLVKNLLESCAKHQAARSGALRTPRVNSVNSTVNCLGKFCQDSGFVSTTRASLRTLALSAPGVSPSKHAMERFSGQMPRLTRACAKSLRVRSWSWAKAFVGKIKIAVAFSRRNKASKIAVK